MSCIEYIAKGILTTRNESAGCLFNRCQDLQVEPVLFLRAYLGQYFQEMQTDLRRIIVIGSADEAEGVRHQDMALRLLLFVSLPLFIFLVRDLLHGGYPVKLEFVDIKASVFHSRFHKRSY